MIFPSHEHSGRLSDKEYQRVKPLYCALRDRLEALAAAAGKSETDVRRASAEIFWALDSQIKNLMPQRLKSRKETPLSREAIHQWEVTALGFFDPDFAASLVRKVVLRRGIGCRKHSEENSIKGAIGVTYDSLPAIQKRAADIVLRKKRFARNNECDPASRIAREVLVEWGSSAPPVRITNPRISIETIVRTALPFLDDLAGKPIRGGTSDVDDLAKMNPPGLGALVAIARMAHKDAGVEHVCDAISACRRNATSVNCCN